ncbi:MAG: hypothetical protein RBS80_05185 [Thermoguttaceae bacterium]|nr:hypothetical protein [Thermoguttaceae bacterium]
MTGTMQTTETLQEFAGWHGPTVRVDREAGVIRGVKILGLRSRNGRVYLPAALAQAAPLYEGAKVNLNHPKGHPARPRDYQDRIGAIRNVELRDGEGLFADFHFNPKHAMAEQLAWDAEHAPGNVGFSHHVHARTARRGEELVVEAITQVESVDLVADPATTRGLFEGGAAGGAPCDLASLSVELLAEHRADLVEAIRAEAAGELQRLREELDRMQRRETARGMLAEFGLPSPDHPSPAARAVTSPEFFESLVAADGEASMRALVEERARLVRSLDGGTGTGAQSRDQLLVESLFRPLDAKTFAAAITGP